jgi:hypothetical protein
VVGHIALLSSTGLRMAAAVSPAETAAVARWLYRFGTLPRGPAIERDFGADDEPMAVLGLNKGGQTRRILEGVYDAATILGWYSFTEPNALDQLPRACKLYISPRPEALTDAFPIIAEQFVRSKVRCFKVGRGVEGLLRPDKIIAYFDGRTHMEEVATALDASLQGCPAQGTPFTAEAAGGGLLSWGVDPPLGGELESWRGWITKQLAASLTAPRTSPGVDPVSAALRDIASVGVDPDHWSPSADVCWEPNPP